MKKLALALIILLSAGPPLAAGDRTLASSVYHHGGFAAPVLKVTEMLGSVSTMAGGRLAWVANHRFCLGVGGYGLLTDVTREFEEGGPTALLNFGYGGLEIEYVFYPDHMFHFTLYSLIGAGGADFFTREEGSDQEWDGDAFFIAEPGFNLELNIRDGWRLDFGYSYRIVSDLKMEGLDNDDLRDVAASLTLKLGKF